MANEAYVQVLCPTCEKHWEESPDELPAPREDFSCPDCSERRRAAEFMRTDRDLETLKRLG
jgi:tRNA(Ile2) C34 agmatinyltransferase TiaS